ncbi:alkaline phosphatase family protein [Deferrisoma palaeochoriense]
MPRRCILLLLDGLGDRACPALGHRTPLEAAHTPHLERLAARGACGLLHAARPGLALPSEEAHFALFGYGPEEFPGRGALEALGAGIPLGPGDVAFLAHLDHATPDGDGLRLGPERPAASPEEAAALASALPAVEAEGLRLAFHPTGGLHGIVRAEGGASPHVTDTDPLARAEPVLAPRPWARTPEPDAAARTARTLDAFLRACHRALRDHPANRARRARGLPEFNVVVTHRPGRPIRVQPFGERWGLRGLSIGSGLVYRGLARHLGLAFTPDPDTDDPGADYLRRIRLALAADHDFVHVHTKAPDQAAHTKDPRAKVRAIEALDRAVGEAAGELTAPEVLLVVTSDHSTPSTGPLIHSGEPVPLLIHGQGVRRDRVDRFDEVSCAGGALGLVRGRNLLPMVLDLLDRAKLRGLMDTPADQPYWPGPREPWRVEG